MPRLADLFCGEGGAGEGFARAGFTVTGVDIAPQSRYPFEFVQADALEFLAAHGHEFDVVHGSPPCPGYSNMRHLPNAGEHPLLIEPLRALLLELGKPYVIENVVGAPLQNPTMLCGSSFGLGVQRHRLFECSFPLMGPPCAHGQQEPRYRVYQRGRWYLSPVAHVWGRGGGKARDQWGEAMGIDWMSDAGLADAIPPAYTEHIGGFLMAELEARAAA